MRSEVRPYLQSVGFHLSELVLEPRLRWSTKNPLVAANIETVLTNPDVLSALTLAWRESQPGLLEAHEEGGFIVQDAAALLKVIRWPRGASNTIEIPPHDGCKVEGLEIIASFHTHPNIGPDFLQQPSETDKRAVRDDPNLKAPYCAGELVISAALLYFVTPYGSVVELGETGRIMAI
jgi:proteasome lid subunit RPN8/RPN11